MQQSTRQLAFRLPLQLLGRIERCERTLTDSGLSVSRTDVVRLLLTYALNKTGCDVHELIAGTKQVTDDDVSR
jgi:hypothetical protein